MCQLVGGQTGGQACTMTQEGECLLSLLELVGPPTGSCPQGCIRWNKGASRVCPGRSAAIPRTRSLVGTSQVPSQSLLRE